MPKNVPDSKYAITADFLPENALAVSFLLGALKQHACLTINTNGQWSTGFEQSTESSYRYTEKLVLVGQAINASTINTIVANYFANTLCEIRLHDLHESFEQQAITLTLYHNDNDSKLAISVISEISKAFFIDCFKVSDVALNQPGLLVMDMDSTIINMECIDEIAALAGVGEKVSDLTERAMQGELDFNQSLNARVACLSGIEVSQLEALKNRLPVNPGFAKTIQILQDNGWHTVIASGGFTYFANYLKDTFELSMAVSNTLGIKDGVLNGTVEGDIVNGEMKRQILLQEKANKQVSQSQTIAIGDGANDLLMMDAAALGVAYKAKAKVKLQADACIEYCGFEGLLYCLRS